MFVWSSCNCLDETRQTMFLMYSSIIVHFSPQTYPPKRDGDTQVSSSEESYTHAKDFLEGLKSGKTDSSTSKYRDHRERNQRHVVCASHKPLFWEGEHSILLWSTCWYNHLLVIVSYMVLFVQKQDHNASCLSNSEKLYCTSTKYAVNLAMNNRQ